MGIVLIYIAWEGILFIHFNLIHHDESKSDYLFILVIFKARSKKGFLDTRHLRYTLTFMKIKCKHKTFSFSFQSLLQLRRDS